MGAITEREIGMRTAKRIMSATADAVDHLMRGDRLDDEELPEGVIERCLWDGDVELDDMVDWFRKQMLGYLYGKGGKVMRTTNIPASVVADAVAVCGSIYRMNASYAVGYAFNCGTDEVSRGEFLARTEMDVSADEWDGLISFEDKTLTDLASGEVIRLGHKQV